MMTNCNIKTRSDDNLVEAKKLKFALCLFRYFPYSGLAKDFLIYAKKLYQRGHHVDCYVYDWQGDFYQPEKEYDGTFNIFVLPSKKISNHTKDATFYRTVRPFLKSCGYDCIIGFNKMPELDIYYMGDFCYADRVAKKYQDMYMLAKVLPRANHFRRFEFSVFSPQSKTKILSISNLEKKIYQQTYRTEKERFFHLPAMIPQNALNCQQHYQSIRANKRKALEINDNTKIILFVGSGFKIKGLDRAIKSISAYKSIMDENLDFRFLVIGQDDSSLYKKMIEEEKLTKHIEFLGGRNDVVDFMCAADVLLHPAYRETTGLVILEAMAVGLPVITTEHCGYAEYVGKAKAGKICEEPVDDFKIAKNIDEMLSLSEQQLQSMQIRSREYCRQSEFQKTPKYAIDIIESIAQNLAKSSKPNHSKVLTISTCYFIYRYFYQYHCQEINQLLNFPDKKIDMLQDGVIKNDQTTTVASILLNNHKYIIKRYNTKSLWHIVKRSVRKTRAHNCWNFSQFLIKHKVFTPAPVAFRENRVGILRRRSYYLCEYIEGKTLFQYLETTDSFEKKLQHVAVKMKEFFDTMLDLRVSHGDLKATNFLIDNQDHLIVLDLDGMRSYSSIFLTRHKVFRDKRRFLQNWINDKNIYEIMYDIILNDNEKKRISRNINESAKVFIEKD